jgi:DGQHR domain-containing protein
MLAIRVKQKDGTFYLVNYKAPDVLRRVRFLNRYYQEGEEVLEFEARPGEEEIVNFIKGVERGDKAFQRGLIRRKVKDILNFYETAQAQPMIPGPVLLYTSEKLKFQPMGSFQSMGDLSEPEEPFMIIDGQHRLAGLRVFQQRHPEEMESVEVPTIIFDGKQEDFAAEMFVIINSTHTRINRSHLIDLMERVTYGTSPEKKWAAWIVTRLYDDDRSPLQYKINKLGGRSKQEKWILQSELYNEIYRLVDPRRDKPSTKEDDDSVSIHRYIATDFGWDRRGPAADMFIDYFKAVQETMKDVWGSKSHMFTTSVTLKALVRAFGDILSFPAVRKNWREQKTPEAFVPFLEGWKEMAPEFRREGFYERFAAKGQIERVRKIYTELARRL